jgi:hypothetical protein
VVRQIRRGGREGDKDVWPVVRTVERHGTRSTATVPSPSTLTCAFAASPSAPSERLTSVVVPVLMSRRNRFAWRTSDPAANGATETNAA